MEPAKRVTAYINAKGVAHRLVAHAPTRTLLEAAASAQLDYHDMVRAVMLEDEQGLLMAVLPARYLLDFSSLCEQLGRTLQPASRERLLATFSDCQPGSVPPLAEPYNLLAIVDDHVAGMERVCFEPGSHQHLMLMAGPHFMELHTQSRKLTFARPAAALAGQTNYAFVGNHSADGIKALHPGSDLQQRLEKVTSLPPLPESSRQLLRLRNNPKATLGELVDIVAADPMLAAQLMRYARSAYYGYRGRVDTLPDAIGRMLGFDLALHLAMGLAASQAVRMPADGPLGRDAFWRHSVYAAGLAQALNTLLPPVIRGKPGLVYLAGLLHDIGFAALGELFQPEFFLLNQAVAANPKVPVTLIEKRVLGIEHTQIGAMLLQAWEMPEEIITSSLQHHDEYYRGPHATYANLVLLAEHLLKAYGPSDAAASEPPSIILTALGLDRQRVMEVTTKVMEESRPGLDEMARAMIGSGQ